MPDRSKGFDVAGFVTDLVSQPFVNKLGEYLTGGDDTPEEPPGNEKADLMHEVAEALGYGPGSWPGWSRIVDQIREEHAFCTSTDNKVMADDEFVRGVREALGMRHESHDELLAGIKVIIENSSEVANHNDALLGERVRARSTRDTLDGVGEFLCRDGQKKSNWNILQAARDLRQRIDRVRTALNPDRPEDAPDAEIFEQIEQAISERDDAVREVGQQASERTAEARESFPHIKLRVGDIIRAHDEVGLGSDPHIVVSYRLADSRWVFTVLADPEYGSEEWHKLRQARDVAHEIVQDRNTVSPPKADIPEAPEPAPAPVTAPVANKVHEVLLALVDETFGCYSARAIELRKVLTG